MILLIRSVCANDYQLDLQEDASFAAKLQIIPCRYVSYEYERVFGSSAHISNRCKY